MKTGDMADRCRWHINVKMDLKQIGWQGVKWIQPLHYRDRWNALVNMVLAFRVP
jgi:hypothetical protein